MTRPTPQMLYRLALDASVSYTTIKRLFACCSTRPSIRERIEHAAAKNGVELPPAVLPLLRAARETAKPQTPASRQ